MGILNIKTGEDFERLVLGVSHADFKSFPGQNRKLNFHDSVKQVMQMQGHFNWNPKRPCTDLSKSLYEDVCSFLTPKEIKKLRLFVSVGTRLDYHFGTDCFFELDNSVATVDLTISKWKICKANVLIRLDDISSGTQFRKKLPRRICRFLRKDT